MPRFLVEALTAPVVFGKESGQRKGLDKSRLVGVVDASWPEDAVKKLTSTESVFALDVGTRYRVTPFDPKESVEVWARYERPGQSMREGQYDSGEVVVMRAGR